jgi:predicted phage terminase large subunit-like protein
LGKHPKRNIIAASYNSDLATDFGREVRNIVGTKRYRTLFATELAQDSTAANRWHTDKGGMYVAAGIGTAMTGRGSHILLIDDPFKDREEADSANQREKVWRWYTSTAYTRLESDIVADVTADDELWHDLLDDIGSGKAEPFEGAIILVNTRWHEDDLDGRLDQAQLAGGDQWEILDLPAILSTGEALWPEKYPLEKLEKIRSVIGTRDWSALYQQQPAPDEGDYFKRDWFKYYTERPANLRIYGTSDYAVTEAGGDYTVHLVFGVDPEDNIFLLDLWRDQKTTEHWIEAVIDQMLFHKPMMWAEEQGQIIKGVGPFLAKRMRERKCYVRREQVISAVDKPTRSRSIQGRTSMGKVYLPQGAPWVADFIAELLLFPAGKHDDQVDAFGLIGRMLDELIPATKPKPPTAAKASGYRRLGDDYGDSGWKADT